MLKSVRLLVAGLILTAAATTAVAQNHPMPGHKNAAPVICTGCPDTNSLLQPNDGLPTWPYGGAIVKHVGRYVDSSNVQSYQMWANSYRTARARTIRPALTTRGSAPPRVYIQIGNGVGVYSLDTFFTTRLPGGMINIANKFSGAGSGREKILNWDGFVYPEFSQSGWQIEGGDFQDPMSKGVPFDFDDRGYLYVATERFGWAITQDTGGATGASLPKVMQYVTKTNPEFTKTIENKTGVSPESIVSIKVGSSYYVITADRGSNAALFNVTAPANPSVHGIRTGDKRNGIRAMARDDSTSRLAYIDGSNRLQIFDYSTYISGGEPLYTETGSPGFGDVISIDESGNVWTVNTAGSVYKLTPSGSTYTKQVYTPFTSAFQPLMMSARHGYVAIGGIDKAAASYDVRVLHIEGSNLREADTNNFFKRYYHTAPSGYAEPGSYTAIQSQSADVEIIKWGSTTYLLYSGFGLGDVFELEGGNSININVKGAPFGTTNPNAKSTEPGPYYGDPVTFVATSSSPAVAYDVIWNFGNPEAGSSNNTGRSRTGEDETHQYSGLTTAGAITAAKPVKSQTVQDPNIQTQHNLTLKLPVPRVSVTGTSAPTLAATISGVDVVAGRSFTDASDGAVEGHVAVWNIDGTTTPLKPNETIPVGAVGPHTLQFSGKYGPYDANLNVATPYTTPTLNIGYTVRPFIVKLNAPTATATDYKFTATADWTTDTAVLLGTSNATVVWKVDGAPFAASGVSTSALANLNALPTLTLPKNHASVADGSVTVAIDVTLADTDLLGAAKTYANVAPSATYSTPDPKVIVEGCANAGSPCKLTAASLGNLSMTDWTFEWTLRLNGQVAKQGTGNPYSPIISTQGTYAVELKVKKAIFEATANEQFTAAQSLCGALPQPQLVSINRAGCLSSCAPGTSIEFSVVTQGYTKQACDNYNWTMGDGNTRTGESFTYSYASAGTYNVKMVMSNSGSPTPVEKNITITVTSGTTEPPPTQTCTAPSSITIHPNCSGSPCRTTDTMSFVARRNGSSLQGCDNVTWTFGDGTQSSTKQPSKQYSTAGTYTVTATVSNSFGNSQGTTTVAIAEPPSGNCSVAPTINHFVIEFSGPSSNCTTTNGVSCNGGESVTFTSPSRAGYLVASCDHFEWDFDDGSPKVEAREPSHAFAGGKTYNVKLRVYNNAGQWTFSRNVTVAGQAPTQPIPVLTPNFPSTGVKGRTVTFVATSNTPNTTGWTWSFGDGTANDTSQSSVTAATSTISHTFANKGTYTVKVTARNSLDAPTVPVGTGQAQIVINDAPPIPEYKYLIPVAAYTAGQGGSAWRTDVQIYTSDSTINGANPLKMEAQFKGLTRNLEQIAATRIYVNFLGEYILQGSREDSGPIVITTKNTMAPPQIWTRTYTQTANGTFGQFIPAIRIDNVGGGGAVNAGTYYMAGLRHDSRYRTNVGLLNPNAAAMTATVTVYDAAKFKIGDFTATLQPFQLDQFQLKSKVPSLPADKPFSVKIEVPTGNWMVAYASYIDGLSNDPVYIQALPESDVTSADFKSIVVPGVGHTGQWRSDVTIFNPDPDGVMFDLQYYNSAGEKRGEALSVPLESGKFLEYGDILKQGVLGNVEDGLGMLKVTVKDNHEKYPMVFARTFFDDGANGTFGQGISGFANARANVKPNKPAIIAGVRNSADYYTNIGLVNLGLADVVVTVSLLDPATGAAVKAVPYTIKPGESVVGPFAGSPAQPRGDWNGIQAATFRIEANGSVWAFASVIDNRTKDPEYVPALGTP